MFHLVVHVNWESPPGSPAPGSQLSSAGLGRVDFPDNDPQPGTSGSASGTTAAAAQEVQQHHISNASVSHILQGAADLSPLENVLLGASVRGIQSPLDDIFPSSSDPGAYSSIDDAAEVGTAQGAASALSSAAVELFDVEYAIFQDRSSIALTLRPWIPESEVLRGFDPCSGDPTLSRWPVWYESNSVDGSQSPGRIARAASRVSTASQQDSMRCERNPKSGLQCRIGSIRPPDESPRCHSYDSKFPTQRSHLLFVIGIPARLRLATFLLLLGDSEPVLPDDDNDPTPKGGSATKLPWGIQAARVLHRWSCFNWPISSSKSVASDLNFYSCVLVFGSQKKADDFFLKFHGFFFSSLLKARVHELEKILASHVPASSDQTSRDSVAVLLEKLQGVNVAAQCSHGCIYLVHLASATYRFIHSSLDTTKRGIIGSSISPPLGTLKDNCSTVPSCPSCLEKIDVSVFGIRTHSAVWSIENNHGQPNSQAVPFTTSCSACHAIRFWRSKLAVGKPWPPQSPTSLHTSSDKLAAEEATGSQPELVTRGTSRCLESTSQQHPQVKALDEQVTATEEAVEARTTTTLTGITLSRTTQHFQNNGASDENVPVVEPWKSSSTISDPCPGDSTPGPQNCFFGSLECHNCCLPEGLWICLICGHSGCGRYKHGHAQHHAVESAHRLCLQVSTGRIWDYQGEVFVHRQVVGPPQHPIYPVIDLPFPATECGLTAHDGGVVRPQRGAAAAVPSEVADASSSPQAPTPRDGNSSLSSSESCSSFERSPRKRRLLLPRAAFSFDSLEHLDLSRNRDPLLLLSARDHPCRANGKSSSPDETATAPPLHSPYSRSTEGFECHSRCSSPFSVDAYPLFHDESNFLSSPNAQGHRTRLPGNRGRAVFGVPPYCTGTAPEPLHMEPVEGVGATETCHKRFRSNDRRGDTRYPGVSRRLLNCIQHRIRSSAHLRARKSSGVVVDNVRTAVQHRAFSDDDRASNPKITAPGDGSNPELDGEPHKKDSLTQLCFLLQVVLASQLEQQQYLYKQRFQELETRLSNQLQAQLKKSEDIQIQADRENCEVKQKIQRLKTLLNRQKKLQTKREELEAEVLLLKQLNRTLGQTWRAETASCSNGKETHAESAPAADDSQSSLRTQDGSSTDEVPTQPRCSMKQPAPPVGRSGRLDEMAELRRKQETLQNLEANLRTQIQRLLERLD